MRGRTRLSECPVRRRATSLAPISRDETGRDQKVARRGKRERVSSVATRGDRASPDESRMVPRGACPSFRGEYRASSLPRTRTASVFPKTQSGESESPSGHDRVRAYSIRERRASAGGAARAGFFDPNRNPIACENIRLRPIRAWPEL